MEGYVRRFLRAALLWLLAGTALGAAMAVHPRLAGYRTAHLHALLLGFVMMMIAGVAYHVIPRFAAATLHSPRVARLHLVVANLGLALMVVGFLGRAHGVAGSPALLGVGGGCSLVGAWCFAWNIWRTLDRAVPLPSQPRRGRPLPRHPG
jgi:cbb3-type cytochrome oxidase subunit 1